MYLNEPNEKKKSPHRSSFEVFKSNVCHSVKDSGDINFIIETLESREIRNLYDRKRYLESFYLLAMVDYLSRENDIPICSDYNDLRCQRLQEIIYPMSAVLSDAAINTDKYKFRAVENAIPEFMRFNIAESGIRDVF